MIIFISLMLTYSDVVFPIVRNNYWKYDIVQFKIVKLLRIKLNVILVIIVRLFTHKKKKLTANVTQYKFW